MNHCLPFLLLTSFFIHFCCPTSFGQNQSCATAALITPGTFSIDSLSGTGAIFSGATAAAWYRYEPTESGIFKVSSCGGGVDTRLVVLFLTDCANQSDLQIINSVSDNCTDGIGGNTASEVEVVAQVGFSYVIYWDDAQSAEGFDWTLDFSPQNEALPGHHCETALSITEGIHTVDSLSGNGTAFLDAVSARWYVYNPEDDGYLNISACGSPVDTRLFVWKNTCATKTIVAQNDDGCDDSGASELKNILVENGKDYYIYWDDHASKSGFTFELTLNETTVRTEELAWLEKCLIYPNPFDNQLFIQFKNIDKKELDVFILNQLGQILLSRSNIFTKEETLSIPVQQLPPGLYTLLIQSGTAVFARKIIKK